MSVTSVKPIIKHKPAELVSSPLWRASSTVLTVPFRWFYGVRSAVAGLPLTRVHTRLICPASALFSHQHSLCHGALLCFPLLLLSADTTQIPPFPRQGSASPSAPRRVEPAEVSARVSRTVTGNRNRTHV